MESSSSRVLLLLLYFVIVANCVHETGHSNADCQRTCELPPVPRTCKYSFKVQWFYAMGAACSIGCANSSIANVDGVKCQQHHDCIILDGVSRPVNVVNRQIPGPSIQVCQGDTIVVDVFNNLNTDEGTSIHWHGIKQHGTPYMDGVPMITQCPIEHHQEFRYEFKTIDSAGTHWWHSHSGLQRGDGAYGSLVVRQPAQLDPHSDLFDFDLPEHVFIITDWYHLTAFRTFINEQLAFGVFDPDAILINDKGRRVDGTYNDFSDYEIFNVEKGFRYRFRLIGSGINSCQLTVSIDGHVLKVTAMDGEAVQPYDVTSIALKGADRYDFIVHADQDIGNFWLKVQGHDCKEGLEASAILHYKGAKQETPSYDSIEYPMPEVVLNDCYYTPSDNYVSTTNLNSLDIRATPTEVHSTVYIPIEVIEGRHVFRRRAFWKPPSPFLYQSKDIEADRFCDVGNYTNCHEKLCFCIDTINVKLGEIIELVFVNIGEDWRCHPIHLHGHSFHVVAQQALEHSITMEEFQERDRQGLIQRKLQSAPVKDSAHVPENGYLIIRVVADNPGWWFLHCHSEWHLALQMAMIFKVGDDEDIPPPPHDFPRCGSFTLEDSDDVISSLGVQSYPGVSSNVVSSNFGSGSNFSPYVMENDLNQLEISTSQGSNWTSLNITLGVLLLITGSAAVLLFLYLLNIKRFKNKEVLERTLLMDNQQIKL